MGILSSYFSYLCERIQNISQGFAMWLSKTARGHGGRLRIEWDGTPTGSVFLIGPAATVFTGEIDVPAI